jgi:hypothetical protein
MDEAGIEAALIHRPANARGFRSRCSRPGSCRNSLRWPSGTRGLKLIIDHLGRPSGRKGDAGLENDAALWSNLDQVLALARYPNVAMKATGAPSYFSEPYPYRNIHGHLLPK